MTHRLKATARRGATARRLGSATLLCAAAALLLTGCGRPLPSTSAGGPPTHAASPSATPTPAAPTTAPQPTPTQPTPTEPTPTQGPTKPPVEPKPTKPKPTKPKPGPALYRTGSSGLAVRDLQARLKQIGWFSTDVSGSYGPVTAASVRGFQAKRGFPVTGEVDRRTLDRLRAMTRTPTSDELYNRVPKPTAVGLDPRCLTGRAICVSKRTNSLVWVVDGDAKLRMDVRFGSYLTPTREGSFRVGWKSRHHVSTIYHSAMPYAMFFSGGQAVHYSSDFAARGYAGASHGCVNVRNLAGIQWLFNQVRVGDKVIVYA